MKYYLIFFSLILIESTFGQNILPEASFRSISVGYNLFLVSGSGGSVLKSVDNGKNWMNINPEGFENLDFRSSCILSSSEFVVVSAGDADKKQAIILKTKDAGRSWYKVFETTQKGVFLDGIKFNKNGIGFVVGDAIDEKPYILTSKNFGETWERLEKSVFPDIIKGEASFAASNSSLAVNDKKVWFVTQNRIFVSDNLGKSWRVFKTPFLKTSSSGIFGINFRNKKHGIAVGGDFLEKEKPTLQYAFTSNGGKTWTTEKGAMSLGLSESAFIIDSKTIIKVSLEGTKISKDGGETWSKLDNFPLHALGCISGNCIGVGGKGQLAVYFY